jgi:uncharacterized protein involved in exopolysaccharide biosynthesis
VNTRSEDWVDSYDPVDLRVVIARLWNRRLWIVASIVVGTAIAAAVAFVSTPVYRVVAVLVPAGADRGGMGAGLNSALGQLGGLASLAGINVGGGDIETEESLAVVRSRQFTEAFIESQNLTPVLFAKRWDEQQGTWRAGKKPPTRAEAFKYFDKKIRAVLTDKKTGLVRLQVEWRDREQAAAWANELIRRLNVEMRTRAIDKADASIGYLEKELNGTTTVASREAIGRLIESQIKQRMIANVQQEYAFRVVDKAMAPDADDFVRPQRLLMIGIGLVGGAMLGVLGVLMSGALSPTVRRKLPEAMPRNT